MNDTPHHEAMTEREVLLKRLRYRIRYRGTKELDMSIGAFAREHLEMLSDAELIELEKMLEHNEADLAAWIFHIRPTPDEVNTPLFQKLQVAIRAKK